MAKAKWNMSLSFWARALVEALVSNWQNEGVRAAIKIAAPETFKNGTIDPNQTRISQSKAYTILQGLSKVDENRLVSVARWKNWYSTSLDPRSVGDMEVLKKAINETLKVLGASEIDAPWDLKSLPEVLRSKSPWQSRFEKLQVFSGHGKTDYVDTVHLITGLQREVNYFCCLHTAEHIRDLIDVILLQPHIKTLVFRPIGSEIIRASQEQQNSDDDAPFTPWLLAPWFAPVLYKNLRIVNFKLEQAKRADLSVKVIPFPMLSPSMGALITTPVDNFDDLDGILYSHDWGVKIPAYVDSATATPFLGGNKDAPIVRISLDSDEVITSFVPWGSLDAKSSSTATSAGAFMNSADPSLTEGAFARNIGRNIWLSDDQVEEGMELRKYLEELKKYDKFPNEKE